MAWTVGNSIKWMGNTTDPNLAEGANCDWEVLEVLSSGDYRLGRVSGDDGIVVRKDLCEAKFSLNP